jgi:hypothetical protein
MFRKTILLTLLVLCIFAVPGFSSEPELVAEVGVRILMKSPEKYSQQIKVSGVVSQVVEDAKIFGIIDLEEFKACNSVTCCASLVLPIRWEGTMPEVGQQLTSTGKIQKEGERYLFIGSELVVASPK